MEVKEHNEGEETFEGLEQEFQLVLSELVGGDSRDKLRVTYQKLTDALKKSHDSEKRLMSKCRELNAEMVSNSTKVAAALKLSQEDETTITSLKKELEKAWKMIDTAHDEETRAKETISTLKQDIAHLTQLVEQGAGLTSSGQDHSVNDLLKMNEELNKEKEEVLTTLGSLREDLNKAAITQQEMEALKDNSMETIAQLQQELQVRQNDIYRETRRKTKLEKELKELNAQTETLLEENKTLSLQSQKHTEEQHRLEHLLKDTKILNERVSKDLEQTQQRCSKLQQEVEQQSLSMEQLNQENQQRSNDLKVKEEQVGHMRQEMVKLTKMREAVQKKSHQMEEHKANVEMQRDMLRSQIATLEKEIEAYQKQVETDKKTIEELVRERDNLNKNMTRAADATQKQQDIVKVQEQLKRNLEQEIRSYRDEAQKQRSIIYQLEKDRDRYINETSSLTQKVLQLMDDIKVRETEIFEYKKKSAEAESKIKQQQNLFESVSFERNLYSKDLTSAQEEMLEMKRKMKMRNQQLEHLKEEISGKEASLVKEHQEFQRSEKEKEALKAELQSMKQSVEEMKQHIDSQQAEEQRLLRVITEAENQHIQQKKQLDQVISERDILGTQLLRRNDELALLYEKIRIQQSVLNKGDFQYQQRLEDVRLLKLEIKRLRREKAIQDKTVSNAEDLRRELFHMQRELLRERTRCRALEEQLENPMNVHRWRKLEATDPNKYELIQKIHALQKRLISKTQELVDKELLLQEKEKLYVELKHILARRPGPEAAEQLHQYRRTLIERTKKLKVLTAELNMFESSTQESKKENQRLANELQDIKKKYLSQKQQCREERAAAKVKQLVILPQLNDGPRFMGGGFSLNTPTVK